MKVQLYLIGDNTYTVIQFCGTGAGNGVGAVIDNVKLTYLDCNYWDHLDMNYSIINFNVGYKK